MIIREVSCESFAGMSDKDIALEEGLNLIVGANETGKTTLADLIRALMLQSAFVNGKTDKKFMNLFYPKMASGSQGSPDGTVVFSTEDGDFRLHKEWGTKASSTVSLRTPEGVKVRDEDEIENVISTILGHGKGTYDEVVFSSQRHGFTALANMLESDGGKQAEQAKQDLSSAIAQAVMEVGGFDSDEFSRRLNEKIAGLGMRWDSEQALPEQKRGGGRWVLKKDDASILGAYYALKDAEDELRNAEDSSKNLEAKHDELAGLKEKFAKAQTEIEEFDKARGILSDRNTCKKAFDNAQNAVKNAEQGVSQWEREKENAEVELQDARDAARDWPKFSKQILEIKRLSDEREKAERREELRTRVETLSDLKGKVDSAAQAIDLDAPTEKDVQDAKGYEQDIVRAKAELAGLNISAMLENGSGANVSVRTCAEDKEVAIADGRFEITESVRIEIPGVLCLTLSPKGLDVEAVKRDIEDKQSELDRLLAGFEAEDIACMKDRYSKARDANRDATQAAERYEESLGADSFDKLEEELKGLEDSVRSLEEIDDDLRRICEEQEPQEFSGKLKGKVENYEGKYGSQDAIASIVEGKHDDLNTAETNLKEANDKKDEEKKNLEEAESALRDAPAVDGKFDGIEDLAEYRNGLVNNRNDIEAEKIGCAQSLGGLQKAAEEASEEDAQAKVEDCERRLEERKAEYARWLHIREVFEGVKATDGGSPVEQITHSFKSYLAEIAGDGIEVADLSESLDLQMNSGKSRLSWDIASDGTKDTISLAFRLAVLDSLFPNGGGLIVLDDPFTDMDPERTDKACAMVEKFAERNQVIFLTCDPKYKDKLSGANIVEWA